MKPVNAEEFRVLAQRRLPRMVFDYLDGGAGDERCLRRNRAAFEAIRVRPGILRDVSRRDLGTELFGRAQSMPAVIAPTGLNGLLWPEGDLALARAAAAAGIPFALSTASNISVEDLARRATGELWFQLYVMQRELARQLTSRAWQVGIRTLILTVDVVVNGRRERDLRNGFTVPFRFTPRTVLDCALHPGWAARLLAHGQPRLANLVAPGGSGMNAQATLMRRQMDATFAWDDLKALRDSWAGTLLVKGVLDPADAARCAAIGADGVILSNHGGRQLDDAEAPLDVLPEAAMACSKPILVDSGIRRGADIVKAVALGARAVLIGRAALYGLAAQGEQGVMQVLRMLREEMDTTMALIGCAGVGDLSRDHLVMGPSVQAGTRA